MADQVGVRELRQNLSKYLDRVKAGEDLVVTERGQEVARLIPSSPVVSEEHRELARLFGATLPTARIEDVTAQLSGRAAPDGTTDAFLAESRDR